MPETISDVARRRRDQPTDLTAIAPPTTTDRKTRWRLRWLCIGGLMVGVALWASNIRTSTGPDAGATFSGSAMATPATGPRFRVGLFNIHGGRGPDKVRDLTRTADCVRDLDLVGMNEVLGPKLWWQTDQCQQLSALLGVPYLFAPTEARWWDGSFGNGLLCRLPVSAWQRIPLPRAGAHTHRNVVFSTIQVGSQTVHVLLTHLDSRDALRRQEQLRTVGELFLALDPPAILMGDMNTLPDDDQLQQLLVMPGVVDAVAAGMSEPPERRIDWILTRGLRTVAAGCQDQGASDHPLYWAELEVID